MLQTLGIKPIKMLVKTLSPKPVTRQWTSPYATALTLNLTKIVNSLLFCRSHFSRYSSITKFFTKELDFLIQSSFWGKISLREKSLMQFLALRCFGLLVIQENAFSYFCFRHSRREISRDIFCGPWNLGNLMPPIVQQNLNRGKSFKMSLVGPWPESTSEVDWSNFELIDKAPKTDRINSKWWFRWVVR